MVSIKSDKIERVLGIYTKLMNGYLIGKTEEAVNYGVNERSIQRDIDDIRNYLVTEGEGNGCINSVIYDRIGKGYRLEQIYRMRFSNSEVLALCKILLDSRAFTKLEMTEMMDKLISCCVPKSNQKLVTDLISNELFHYVEPRHNTKFIDAMWEVGQAVRGCKFKYMGLDIDAVLDRLPTAQILSEKDGVYTVSEEVFGKGIDMWLKSQGDNITVL